MDKIRPEDLRLASRACRVMTNGDAAGPIFLSYPHSNNGLFFLLTTVLFNYLFEISFQKSLNKMHFHMVTLLDVLGKIALVG